MLDKILSSNFLGSDVDELEREVTSNIPMYINLSSTADLHTSGTPYQLATGSTLLKILSWKSAVLIRNVQGWLA
jgi:hypothetical protein